MEGKETLLEKNSLRKNRSRNWINERRKLKDREELNARVFSPSFFIRGFATGGLAFSILIIGLRQSRCLDFCFFDQPGSYTNMKPTNPERFDLSFHKLNNFMCLQKRKLQNAQSMVMKGEKLEWHICCSFVVVLLEPAACEYACLH